MYAVLRTLKWKPLTQHFKEHYLPIMLSGLLHIYYSNGDYALVNTRTSEWAKAPLFVVNTLQDLKSTCERGPFVFKNGFDQEEEAAYLIQMLQYSELTAKAQQKVDTIKQKYADWISYDIEVAEMLRRHIKWL